MASIWDWSSTAASNANSDGDINWAEGQNPNTVNDSARFMMKRVRDLATDIGGATLVTGTANGLLLTAANAFTTYATGRIVCFRAALDNTGATTLNVNGIGAKSVRYMGGTTDVAISAGMLRIGGIYQAIYGAHLDSNGGGWALVNPSLEPVFSTVMPIGAGMDYWGTTAPTGFIFPYGQAISRTTYAALFAVLGTQYGVGDGSTTFNVPDKRGRTSFGKDDMGGTSANRLTDQTGGINGDVLGDTGGSETHTLTTAQLPSHLHAAGTLATAAAGGQAITVELLTSTAPNANATAGSAAAQGTGAVGVNTAGVASSVDDHTHTITGSTGGTGSGNAHNILPPGIVCNYIIKAL